MCLAPHHVPTGVATVVTPGLTARRVSLRPRKIRHRLETRTSRAFTGGGWKAVPTSRVFTGGCKALPVKGFQLSAYFRCVPSQRYGMALGGALPFGSNSPICP